MTLQEAATHTTDRLSQIYEMGEAGAITDLVLENMTGLRRSDRSTQQRKDLSIEQASLLEQHIHRLLTHEPVQYVLQEAWFCGLRFFVDHRVLIPRPETEELVEWVISNCRFPISPLSLLDVGTGSGCIPIALRRRLGKCSATGIDRSPGAIAVARENASTLGVEVEFIEMDFLDPQKQEQLLSFDIIVSNPPYIPERERSTMQRNVVDFEPAEALFVPNDDALLFYRALAEFGIDHLQKGGSIFSEIHESLAVECQNTFNASGYNVEIKRDMQGKERMLKASRPIA